MALTNKVKEFFTNKINQHIDGQIEEIKKTINESIIEDSTLAFVEREYGANPRNLMDEVTRLKKEERRIDSELSRAKGDLERAADNLGVFCDRWGEYRDFIPNIVKKYGMDIIKQLYPEQYEKIDKMEKTKNDVEGAVLLATTEQKLVDALTRLLESYGADLGDLKNIIGL